MTALSFDLDPTDVAVIALLHSPGNLSVQVGTVADSDAVAQTIGTPLPYVLYSSTLPYQPGPQRLGRAFAPDVTNFTLTTVHSSLDGCKAVAAAVRGLLAGSPVSVDGSTRRIWLADPEEPVTVTKDQTWTRPDGGPLFFALDRYHVV